MKPNQSEVTNLLRRYRDGDTQVKERIVELHIGLVRSVASHFNSDADEQQDLEQLGFIGLLKAMDRFDPSRGTQFATYATPLIQGEIQHHLRDKTKVIRHPRSVTDTLTMYPLYTSEADTTIQDILGDEDQNLHRVENRLVLDQATRYLTTRERLVLEARYLQDLSPSETAIRLGMHKAHVSRLQASALMHCRSLGLDG